MMQDDESYEPEFDDEVSPGLRATMEAENRTAWEYDVVETTTARSRNRKWSVRFRGKHIGAITEVYLINKTGYKVWKDRTTWDTVDDAAEHIADLALANLEQALERVIEWALNVGLTPDEIKACVDEIQSLLQAVDE